MSTKYFTLEEANTLLPQIEPLMAQLLEKRAKVARLSQEIESLLVDIHLDIGGRIPSELAREFRLIELLLAKINSFGCHVKDLNVGLLDFLSERDGREVYLCWRYGEPAIAFFHELHSGFNDRQPV